MRMDETLNCSLSTTDIDQHMNFNQFQDRHSLAESLASLDQLLSKCLLVGTHLLQEGLWVLLKRQPGRRGVEGWVEVGKVGGWITTKGKGSGSCSNASLADGGGRMCVCGWGCRVRRVGGGAG
jgi:hypothetical protein